jgi:alkylation response protein AidB-like acyl-CoA dehydrogenase
MNDRNRVDSPPGGAAAVDWIARARSLAPLVAAAAERTERERRIPPDVLATMHEARLFHMLLPAPLGGGAADLATFNQTVEEIAAADASPAWCLAQSAGSTQAAGYLDPAVAMDVFGAPDALVAWGPPAGVAKAVVAEGGFVVTGRWRFASGSANATWMGGHSTVFDADGAPRLDPAGRPVNRTMIFRRARATILDTWHVVGLRGTSSNDYEVADLFVPDAYTTWRDLAADRRDAWPLYSVPLLTVYGIGFSGVALGLARACLNAFMNLAETKRPGGAFGLQTLLRDNAVIQAEVARAPGRLNSSRAFLLQMLREVWDAAAAADKLPVDLRAQLRIAITASIDHARSVVDFCYRAAGTNAIFEGSPFERRFRDMHALAAQGQAHLSNYEAAGQALFGFEPGHRL